MEVRDRQMEKWDLYRAGAAAWLAPSERLCVTVAGRFFAGPGYRCAPRTLADEYVFIYTEAGQGTVRAGEAQTRAGPGDAFLLPPGLEHEYGTAGPCWHLLWFHCTGPLPGELRLPCWIPPTPCGAGSPLPRLVEAIVLELAGQQPYCALAARSYAEAALVELARSYAATGSGGWQSESRRLAEQLAGYVTTHLAEPVNLSQLARALHVSPRHLARLCRLLLGQSPRQYVLALKLAEAKRLLLTTHLTVAEVAARVGIQDPYYFSRLFRQKVGQSPTAFRHEPRPTGGFRGEA